jgi:hypothetical protein
MRTHRITGVVVSLALVGGAAGGVLAASSASADTPSQHLRTSRPVAAPADATTIIAQARTLGRVGHVASPVAVFVEDAVAGKTTADTLAKEADAARAAVESTRQAHAQKAGSRVARDAATDALTQLQTALDTLVKSLTDTVGGLLSAATGVVSGLVDTLGALLGGLTGTASAAPSTAPAAPAAPAS